MVCPRLERSLNVTTIILNRVAIKRKNRKQSNRHLCRSLSRFARLIRKPQRKSRCDLHNAPNRFKMILEKALGMQIEAECPVSSLRSVFNIK